MNIKPIIDNVNLNGLDPKKDKFTAKTILIKTGFTLGFTLVTFVLLLLLTSGEMSTKIATSLIISLLVGLPTAFLSLVQKPTANLDLIAEQNLKRIKTGQLLPSSLHKMSAIGQVISSTTKDKFESSTRTINALVSGQSTNPKFMLGRIESTNSVYRDYLVIKITLPPNCPQVLIDYDGQGSKGMTKFDRQLQDSQKFNLEGNFADYFTLYAANPNIARFATYVLTPDVMELLMKLAPTADIEIVGDQLIIIWKTRNRSNNWAYALPELFYTLNTIAAKLYEQINIYQKHNRTVGEQYLRFSFVPNALNKTRTALGSVEGNAGLAIDMLRRRGFWLLIFGILIGLIVITVLLAVIVTISPLV